MPRGERVAALFLLWLSFIPGINNLGQVLVIVVLAALAVVGIEILRRQTAREFPASPEQPLSDAGQVRWAESHPLCPNPR